MAGSGDSLIAENELMAKVAKGDRRAFTLLYEDLLQPLYTFVYPFTASREDTEEILQDVFAKVWEKRERLGEIENFKGYIFRIARNRVLNFLTERKTYLRHNSKAASTEARLAGSADQDILLEQYLSLARTAINGLTSRRRQIFDLVTQQDMSLDEVAEHLGIAKSTVKVQLYEAMATVRQHLREHGELHVLLVLFLSLFDHT